MWALLGGTPSPDRPAIPFSSASGRKANTADAALLKLKLSLAQNRLLVYSRLDTPLDGEGTQWRRPRALIGTDCCFRRIASNSRWGARARDEADLQAPRSNGSDARWSETPDRDLDA